MPKPPPKDPAVSDLTVRERMLLFCVASGIDWQASVPVETVTGMIVKGLVARDSLGRLALTGRGRAKAKLPEL